MSPAGRRPPAPVRRPAQRPARATQPVEQPVEQPVDQRVEQPVERVVLPETRPASPQAAAAPARPPAREGRATAPAPARGRWRPARSRSPWAVAGVALVVVLLLAGAGWALLGSPLTELRAVTVRGADRTGPAAVEQAAADQRGLPLLRVDTGAVADRVRALPWTASVQVERDFPHGLSVVVVEKTPVAAVAAPDGAPGVVLLDGQGRRITTADAPPDGVPLVGVDVATAGAGAVRAASAVALALPADLRAEVTGVTAVGPDDVRLALRSGQEVRWGGPGQDDLKARVALLLLARDGVTRVDVSAPTAPATA